MIRQTLGIFVDAYRELNAKKLFWAVLGLSLICVAALACIGIYETPRPNGTVERGITLLVWRFPIQIFDLLNLSKKTFYNLLFFSVGFKVWLTWAATILALVSTAGIIPDFITGGAVEMVLSKPIGRLRLFLTKYVAGLLFVVLQVSVFAVASWLVIGIRAGSWQPVFFLSIPIVTALFSYLFAFQVLIGMLTRSAIAALLITVCLWLCIFVLHVVESGAILDARVRKDQEVILRDNDLEEYRKDVEAKRQEAAGASEDLREPLAQTLHAMETSLSGKESRLAETRQDRTTLRRVHAILFATKTVLPKTSETIDLMQRWLVSAAELEGLIENAPEPARQRRGFGDDVRVSSRSVQRQVERELRERSVGWVLGTSLLFEAVVVGIAAWLFCRRDF